MTRSVIAIDLGTTTSVVAIIEAGQPNVLQGERPMARDNRRLGRVHLCPFSRAR